MLMVTKSSRPAGIRSCPGPSLPSGNQPELADRRWLPGPATLGRVQSSVAAGHREVHVSRRAVAEEQATTHAPARCPPGLSSTGRVLLRGPLSREPPATGLLVGREWLGQPGPCRS